MMSYVKELKKTTKTTIVHYTKSTRVRGGRVNDQQLNRD